MSATVRRQDTGEARREHGKAWLTTLGTGVAFIGFANLVGVGPWWMALALSALMVAFGVSIRDTEVSSDSKGESFYYVGLIFTFVALVAALVVFDGVSDATRTIGIIRNFGIALVTTIWGLAGRVWYAMSGDAPGDLEEAIRVDLEEAVSEMKGSLDRARDQLDILVDTFEVSGKAMVATVGKISDTADRAAQTTDRLDMLANSLAGAAEAIAENVNAFHGAIEGGAKAACSLRESLDETGERSASLGRELASAGTGFRAFTTVVAEAGKAAVPVARTIREASDGLASAASETASLRGAISGMRTRAQDIRNAVEQIGSDAEEAGGTLGKARRDIADVDASAGSLKGQLDTIDGLALWESVGSARKRSDELGSDLSELRRQSAKVSQHLAKAEHEADKLSDETIEARRMVRVRRNATGLFRRIGGLFARGRARGPNSDDR